MEGNPVRRLLILALTATCAPVFAQQGIDYSRLEIKTTDLGNGVYLLNWQGGDSLFLVGDDGVLLVDTSVAQMGARIKAAIAKVSTKPIKLVINTHAHADHFGANELMAQGGAVIVGHDALRERMVKGQYLAAFNQTIPPSPPVALPTITYADAMTLHFDGETVELIHVPRAHTDNDTLVRFKRANVIHASGTIGGNGGYPFFDMSSGGSLAGTIAAEEKMLSLSDDKTRIVPDEGDSASTADLKASRDALVTIKARVQKLIDDGKSEAEAIAAKPTRDLDARWAPRGGFLSGDVVTRMAYQSLQGITPPARP
jgi:glyoxylase-like metal-dependent hydrolase (beta-lactamase superfamily II)